MITYEEIKENEVIKTYINAADDSLSALGYTEHCFAHVTYVAEKAGSILAELTNCVAVSSSPADSEAHIRRIELVPLSRSTAMIVLLATSGILKSAVVRSENEINVDIAEVFYNI